MRPKPIRATLRRLDGAFVRRTHLSETDEFVLCLLTGRYYDRTPGTTTFVERFWPHHWQRIKDKIGAMTGDPLDAARADSALPIWYHGGMY